MSSIILAGGHSSRLRQDKCSLVLAGERVLQRLIIRLSGLGGDVIVVLAQGQKEPFLPRQVKIATDTYSGRGPLMGIYSGLKLSQDPHSVVVACDMPFLNVNLLHYMMDIAGGFDVVMLKIGGLVEPLHAVYSTKCLPIMESMLDDGNFKVSDLLQRVKVRYVEESEVDSFDPQRLSFFNINTPADLERAERIVSREGVRNDLC